MIERSAFLLPARRPLRPPDTAPPSEVVCFEIGKTKRTKRTKRPTGGRTMAMSTKIISVKCEMNEKNKDIIKHALCDALETDYSRWTGDSFEGKDKEKRVEYEIKINESLLSNGYRIDVSFEVRSLSICLLSFFLLAIIFGVSILLVNRSGFLLGFLMWVVMYGLLFLSLLVYSMHFDPAAKIFNIIEGVEKIL